VGDVLANIGENPGEFAGNAVCYSAGNAFAVASYLLGRQIAISSSPTGDILAHMNHAGDTLMGSAGPAGIAIATYYFCYRLSQKFAKESG
jgi:hypothetical protein